MLIIKLIANNFAYYNIPYYLDRIYEDVNALQEKFGIEIIKLDDEFNTVWKFSGRDIFVSVSGKNAFELTEQSIKLYDFEDNFYEIDFDGKLINEELKVKQ